MMKVEMIKHCCRKLRFFILFLAICIASGCNSVSPQADGHFLRLYPVGERLNLIEYDSGENHELHTLKKEALSSFYRINVHDVARPGKVIFPGQNWIVSRDLDGRYKLVFNYYFVGNSNHQSKLNVTVKTSGRTIINESFSEEYSNHAISVWTKKTIPLSDIARGLISVSFSLIPEENTELNDSVVLIGSPSLIPEKHSQKQPNVVLFLIDTLRADHLGCYGSPEALSPSFDSLSKHSTLFSQLIAASSWTKPSVNSIFTGLYPDKNQLLGAPYSQIKIPFLILTDILAKQEYETIGLSSNLLVTPLEEYDRGFDVFDSSCIEWSRANTTWKMFSHIDNRLPEDSDIPFFMFAHCMDPHDRYVPPFPFDKMFHRKEIPVNSDKNLGYQHAMYNGEIRCMDQMMGQFTSMLKARYPEDEFLFVVVADHGEGFMEHGQIGHAKDLYQEQIHVPWLISTLDSGQKQKILSNNCSHVDLIPTLASVLNLPVEVPGDGLNCLAPYPGDRLIWSFLGNYRSPKPVFRMAMSGPMKVIKETDKTYIKFDLDNDPGEIRPESVAENNRLAKAVIKLMKEEKNRKGFYESSKKVKSRLKALGYME